MLSGYQYGATQPDNIAATLRHHDQQLASLTTKVGGIESTLGTLVSSVSDIRTAVTRSEATKPASLGAIMGMISQTLTIMAVLIGGVVWIAIQLSKPNFEAAAVRDEFTRFRIETLERDARASLRQQRYGAGLEAINPSTITRGQ